MTEYLYYIRDENTSYYKPDGVLLYNISSKLLTYIEGRELVRMFPPPKNGAAMWGTPFGHLTTYANLKRIDTLDEFHRIIATKPISISMGLNEHISSQYENFEFKPDTIVQSVIDSFIQRAKIGKEKYGQTLDREDLSVIDWIRHAKEEHMDAILYLTKLEKVLLEKNNHGSESIMDK